MCNCGAQHGMHKCTNNEFFMSEKGSRYFRSSGKSVIVTSTGSRLHPRPLKLVKTAEHKQITSCRLCLHDVICLCSAVLISF